MGADLSGQNLSRLPWEMVREVMPEADRFDDVSGDPPVIRGYSVAADGSESLVGYVFVTSDLPPEQFGYSGTIETLIGMRPDGTLTGVRVVDYQESYMRQMGDFLRQRGFQEQFENKYIGDPFRVWGDVDGISRVSISVRALSRGVRNSSRRVAAAYSGAGPGVVEVDPAADITKMSWFELRQAGVVERFEVTEPGQGSAGISLSYVGSDRLGEYFLGRVLYERALRAIARRDGADHLMLYTVDGARLRLFVRDGWSIAQDGDTTAIDPSDIVTLGLPSGGIVAGEATMVGVMMIRRELDIRRPFDFVYDIGEFGVHSVPYTTQDARIIMAEDAAAAAAAAQPVVTATPDPAPPATSTSDEAAGPDVTAADPVALPVVEGAESPPTTPPSEPSTGVSVGTELPDGAPTAEEPAGEESVAAAADIADSAGTPFATPTQQTPPFDAAGDFDFAISEDETLLERTIADTSWTRVAKMLLVLALATWAFFAKSPTIRWASLGVTIGVLGFLDGSFLSVSHITSGIWGGPGVFLRDIPLLLIVVFTLVTTLIWGRVFCGFLCPFGALQDIIDRVVPESLKRPLPQAVHDRVIWIKYGILALIVVPALAGSHASFYQYFEPFGTVFFLSTSVMFWAIAGGFLVLSAVVPRFYCRYACPLGAALAVTSVFSPKRIARVEQCDHCKVCEQTCPTGAIRGPDIDFKECVRCNACEIQLIEKTGVCRHEMEEIRPRLVQLQAKRVDVVDA